MLEWIMAPLVGALIGLITNGIAIRMLFRPFHEIRIGKFRLPFTPGLIPKEQPRLAAAIGKVVGERLLDSDTLQKALASDALHEAFERKIDQTVESLAHREETVREYLAGLGVCAPADAAAAYVGERLSVFVTGQMEEKKIGDTILEYAIREVLSNLNPMVAMMAEPAIRKSQDAIALRIEETIQEECPSVICAYVEDEYEKWMDCPVKEVAVKLWQKKDRVKEKIWGIYLELLEKKSGRFFERLDVSGIVEQKIREFDTQELEDLILEIARKELNALVWLGGLLGAVMGMINLLY